MRRVNRRAVMLWAAACAGVPGGACGDIYGIEQLRGRAPRWTDVEPEALGGVPFASIGSLGAWRGLDLARHFGTVWICGAGRVATAAHVLHDALTFGLADGQTLRLKLGYTRGEPPGQDIPLTKVQLKPHPLATGDADYDVGVIECAVSGPSLLGRVCEEQTAEVFVSGYPTLRRPGSSYRGDVLVAHSGRAWRRNKQFIHDTDTTPGHSGAAMLRRGPGGDGWEAVAIHVAPDVFRDNKGVWINEEVATYLRG